MLEFPGTPTQKESTVIGCARDDRMKEGRLADARVAPDDSDAAAAGPGSVDDGCEKCELAITTPKRSFRNVSRPIIRHSDQR